MSALVFDIETVALASSLNAPYPEGERNPPSNWKDAEKIAAWYEADKVKWADERAKECSLNPRLGRIVCAGVAPTDVDGAGHVHLAMDEEAEANALLGMWRDIDDADGKIVTFNGLGFDVPFFLFRSLVNGIKPTIPTRTLRDWTRRYSYAPHYDVRAVLTGWDKWQSGNLTDFSECLGCLTPQNHSGSDIFDLYQAGNFDAIAEHCRTDVQDTKNLYLKVSQLYGSCE